MLWIMVNASYLSGPPKIVGPFHGMPAASLSLQKWASPPVARGTTNSKLPLLPKRLWMRTGLPINERFEKGDGWTPIKLIFWFPFPGVDVVVVGGGPVIVGGLSGGAPNIGGLLDVGGFTVVGKVGGVVLSMPIA